MYLTIPPPSEFTAATTVKNYAPVVQATDMRL